MFEIFVISKCIQFTLTCFGKYICVVKSAGKVSFLPPTNISVTTTWLSLLLLIILATISSNTIQTLHFLPELYSLIFTDTSCILFKYSIKTFGLLNSLRQTFINKILLFYFIRIFNIYIHFTINTIIITIILFFFVRLSNALVFPYPEPQLLIFSVDDQELVVNLDYVHLCFLL